MTDLAHQQLLDRIVALEDKFNEMQTALGLLGTKAQIKQLLSTRQSEIETLKTRVTSLETQILALQSLH